jgi:ATP-dependent helicase HrpB
VTVLPIDPYVPQVLDAVRQRRAVIVSAAPGAGKTTRVPPALAVDGAVIVLQPRRVAARSMAHRIAAEQGWTLGREVGWHVRFERKFTRDTRVLFATEGILTARLQQDPLLGDFRTVVLDEFHERSIHADLGLALARQAWRARDDLRIVVMSATLDTARVAAFLDGATVVDVPGRVHAIDVAYRPARTLAAVAGDVIRETSGGVLCFLPGAPEINRALADVRDAVAGAADVLTLHGSLPSDEQDRAIAASDRRRVILATNIAETSLTVPGVTAVIDAGLQKIARYDPDRGIDSLELERISAQSAQQRAGRAGRLAPGVVRRLWDESDRLRPETEAEVHRVDLSDAVLDVLAWGGDPLTFEWFDAPAAERIGAAMILLEQLGAVAAGRVTEIGARLRRLPLHPRLARMLVESGAREDLARACALLSERHSRPAHPATTTSDLLAAADDERSLPPHVRDVAGRLVQAVRADGGAPSAAARDERAFLRAILAGYPDRVAKRRAPGSPRFRRASGHGAVLGRESGVRDAEFIVAVDVQAGRAGPGSEATIRIASAIEPEWLPRTRGSRNTRNTRIDHVVDESGRIRAIEREMYGEIVVAERPAQIDPEIAGALLADAYLRRGLSDADAQLLRRLRFADLPSELAPLAAAAATGRRAVEEIDLRDALDHRASSELDRLAPERLAVPSGRTAPVRYEEDGSVTAAVKLQELFGLAETPRLGPRRAPVTFELLAPNGRPVQTTRDLRSFWNTTYQQVRKELRGRYPKHPWPEDPWTAPPTARAKRKGQV